MDVTGVSVLHENDGCPVCPHVHVQTEQWCLTSHSPVDALLSVTLLDRCLPGLLASVLLPADVVFHRTDRTTTTRADWKTTVRYEEERRRRMPMHPSKGPMRTTSYMDHSPGCTSTVEEDEDDEDEEWDERTESDGEEPTEDGVEWDEEEEEEEGEEEEEEGKGEEEEECGIAKKAASV